MTQVAYNLRGFDFAATAFRLRNRALLPRETRTTLALLLVAWAALVVFFVSIVQDRPDLGLPALFVLLAAILAWILLNRRIQKRLSLLLCEAPSFAGALQLTVTDERFVVENALCRTFHRWGAISELVEQRDALLILMGPLNYTPLPLSAFADAAAKQAFIAELCAHAPQLKVA